MGLLKMKTIQGVFMKQFKGFSGTFYFKDYVRDLKD